jgi:hypothetical protein
MIEMAMNTCRNAHHKRKIKNVSVTTNIIYCNHTGYYQQQKFVGPENKYIIFMIFPYAVDLVQVQHK